MFNEIFVNILQMKNITASKLANDLNLSNSMLTDWKTGARFPSYENLVKLADYFNCSIDSLTGREITILSPEEHALDAFLALPLDARKTFIQEAVKHL